jgi:dTDP-4-amino-4,6-dideoxygalactose transaminase
MLTTSGTDALRLAVLSVAGVARPGDVAVLPSFTFPATAEVLVQLGYELRFCDVDVATWTVDPDDVRTALAPGDVRVVIAVDAMGNPADYQLLTQMCAQAGVALVGDSAPSIGASYRGEPVGTQADAHAFSFSFAKVVSAGGAGGAVVVRRDRLEELAGPANWLRSSLLGELPAIAALDLVQHLDELVSRRQRVADIYSELAARRGGELAPQYVRPGDRHAWVHWVVRVADGGRAAVARRLATLGVQTKPYYSPALHQEYGAPAYLPVTEALVADALALPMSSELTVGDAERIVMAMDVALDELSVGRRRTAAYRGQQALDDPQAPVALEAPRSSPLPAAG